MKRFAHILLLWIGFLLMVIGFWPMTVNWNFSWPFMILAGIGGLDVLLCIYSFIKKKNRKTYTGTQQLSAVVLMIVLLGLILILVNYLGFKTSKSFDVTRFKQHTLSAYTLDVLNQLKPDMKFTILHVGMPPKYLEDLLAEYRLKSKGKIKTEIIDPLVNIGAAAQFGQVIKENEKKAIVTYGNNRKDIDFTNMTLSEEYLTNAAMVVTHGERDVCFLAGHNEFNPEKYDEQGMSKFKELLAEHNIFSHQIFLGVNPVIPKECQALVVAGPKEFLTEKEDEVIQKYLMDGGRALFLVEGVLLTTPDKPLTEKELKLNPSMNSILNSWGINVKDDVVVDISSHASGDVGSPATNNYLTHAALLQDVDYTFYVRPRSIEILRDRSTNLMVVPVVLTKSAKDSWGESNRMLNVVFDENDRPGPVPIAYIIVGKNKPATKIIVFSDAEFLTNAYLNFYSNARMGLNAVSWLTEAEFKPFLNKENAKVATIDLTSQQKRNIAFLLTLLPMFIMFWGLMVWMKRTL